ncbi:MAG: tetratricopeptide repeat protein [Candidatus Glassbacteria bacterium]|nr:tetratricopeptide repeat protein [Candidatus Glassbacteria bacterium]
MSTCPHCGNNIGNGAHFLEDIKWDIVDGKPVIKNEIWKCNKSDERFFGKLDDDASQEAKRDYDTRKYLYWALILESVPGMPLDSNFYMKTAECYAQLGKYKLSLSWLDKALEIDPNNLECTYQKGLIFVRLGKPDKAHLEFLRAANKGHKKSQDYLQNNMN